jgi:hypothetical protein
MALEFVPQTDETFPKVGPPTPLQVISACADDVAFRLVPSGAEQARREARYLDGRWVFCMEIFARLKSSAAMAISDGVTSHMVAVTQVVRGEQDYQAVYIDSWGSQRGSMLQAGKNIAGCAAVPCLQKPGSWAISLGELSAVLDSVTLRRDELEGASHEAASRNAP